MRQDAQQGGQGDRGQIDRGQGDRGRGDRGQLDRGQMDRGQGDRGQGGVTGPGNAPGLRWPPGRPHLLAALATLAWAGAVAALVLTHPEAEGLRSPLPLAATLLAAAVPVALIWVAAALAHSAAQLRADAAQLRRVLQGLRPPGPERGEAAGEPAIARRLDALLAAQRRTESALAQLSTAAAATPAPPAAPPAAPERKAALPGPQPAEAPPPEAQPALALGTADATVRDPVTVPDFLRALHFPDTAEDAEGFAALRRALADPRAARVIRAAQDILTLLSEDGIYMDDLRPAPARPELWRRLAAGERGAAIAPLGGVRDPDVLARAGRRMREDAVFRDVAHHFLRHFDTMLEAFAPNAGDDELTRLAETRSARAFMLMGRVAGMFG